MIASFFVLYITTFAASALVLVTLGVDIVSAMSGVAACMGGVGPGLNTVGPRWQIIFTCRYSANGC